MLHLLYTQKNMRQPFKVYRMLKMIFPVFRVIVRTITLIWYDMMYFMDENAGCQGKVGHFCFFHMCFCWMNEWYRWHFEFWLRFASFSVLHSTFISICKTVLELSNTFQWITGFYLLVWLSFNDENLLDNTRLICFVGNDALNFPSGKISFTVTHGQKLELATMLQPNRTRSWTLTI